MDSARHDRICGIFEQAIALPDEQRAAMLEQTCADDPSLRAEVNALIAAHHQTNPLLEAGILPLLIQSEHDEHPDLTGQRIGRYELKRVIARGGMGIVYEATQDQPRRTVAVKVLRRLGSPLAVRRFHEEAQILARLNHPHIAHVYEAGTHVDGSSRGDSERLPFFAMEYIAEARPLNQFAIEQRLPIRERLYLFIKVCEAVQHGHRKGIIHRDLKPANILVDADGVPKVIDFGVARMLDLDGESRTRHTIVGRVVGTLPYCSPEQMDQNAGDIDSRSDVYALGAVLYELLAGMPAFKTEGRSTWQMMTMIRESSPQRLRDLDSRFRGNLDAIVSRAMEKDPERRYQSVESLQRDVERHLGGEPIEARPQSRWIGATRWIGRHPVVSTTAAAISIAAIVLVATFATIWYGNQQPFEIVTTSDGHAAFMVTRFGRVLATFGGDAAPPSSVSVLFARSPTAGRVVVFMVQEGEHSTNRQLSVARPDSLDQPIWQTVPSEPSVIPDVPLQWDKVPEHTGFGISQFLLADVFAQYPGNEIITLHAAFRGSPHAIRIYDFKGNVLFEAWHFGYVSQIFWWEQQALLVAAGDRHGREDVKRFGYPGLPWPDVIFALRPRLGLKTGWINEDGWPQEWRADADRQGVLAWYKALTPRQYAEVFSAQRIVAAYAPAGKSPYLCVGYQSVDFGGLDLRVGPQGEFLGVLASDEYHLVRDKLPFEDLGLTDWPPPPENN